MIRLQIISFVTFLAAPALAHPNVLVAEFHSKTSVALDVVEDDVRSAIVPVVTGRGGTVLPRATVSAAQRANLPECASDGPACDLAIARVVGADLVITGQLREIDGEMSLSLEVVGTKSGNLLAGRRATGPKLGALAAAASSQASAALEQVFDEHGPPKRGAQASAAPTPARPAPSAERGSAIIHSQKANLFRGIEGVGGTVLLTDVEIRFEPHAMNLQSSSESIPFSEVVSVEPVNNGLVFANGALLHLRTGGERRFVLENRDAFIRLVRDHMTAAP